MKEYPKIEMTMGDILVVRTDVNSTQPEAYVRLGALPPSLIEEITTLIESRSNTSRSLPDGFQLPTIGVTYIIGGDGPAVISMTQNKLRIVTWEEAEPSISTLQITSIRRKDNGISFVDVTGKQHVFTFSERPVPHLPAAWENAFPIDIEISVS